MGVNPFTIIQVYVLSSSNDDNEDEEVYTVFQSPFNLTRNNSIPVGQWNWNVKAYEDAGGGL